jgi:uncharacterized protein YbjQ (UPF0145 family)
MTSQGRYITTASTLDGWQIDVYLGVVSAHVVAGTGLFSDMFAGLSDIFGGRSETYQRHLAEIYDAAVKQVQARAVAMGANWVLGLRVDADQISGKGMQMFMVTAIGTAVRASELRERSSYDVPPPELPSRDLANRIKKNALVADLASGMITLDDATWTFVIKNAVIEFAEKVLEDPPTDPTGPQPDLSQLAKRREAFFQSLPRNNAASALYDALNSSSHATALALITKLYLTDLQRVREALQLPDMDIRHRALQTLRGLQYFYTKRDLQTIDQILELIGPSFPQQAERTKKKGLVGGEKEVWKCSCGRLNSLDDERCGGCKRDLQGFLREELTPTAALVLLTAQRNALSQLLSDG